MAIVLATVCVGVSQAAGPRTAPSAITVGTLSVGETGATLEGSAQPEGLPVDGCVFEYGTSTSYGTTVPCEQAVEQGSEPTAVSASVSGLQPDAAYDFRLLVTSKAGRGEGTNMTFTTAGSARPAPVEKPAPQCAALGVSRARECAAVTTEAADGPGGSDRGLYVAFCPVRGAERGPRSMPRASAANTSEAGWPADQCLKMDKGGWPAHHTLVGERGVHNWLLGGYGNDTIIGSNTGDVIWGDYQPSGGPKVQTATIYAGNGRNVIYADDTHDLVWTGTNPKTVVHAHNAGDSGVIHCQSPGIVVYLSTVSERDFKLYGCHHISHYSVGY